MGAVHKLLERFGFVRLCDYGLVLTPDRRVLSNRQALDDGYGNRIVGWIDGDLAAMELPAWGAPKPSTPPPPLPQRPKPPTPAPQPQPVAAQPVVSWPVVAPTPMPAPPPEPEEEDWEWQIAVARARAAADDEAPSKLQETEPTMVRAVPQLRPLPSVTANGSQVNLAQLRADGTPPRTIIPVPSMPAVDPQLVRSYEPPRRFPRSTNPRLSSTPLVNRNTSRGLSVPAPKRR